ncbi:MAG TPA: protein-L-isoaspartate(D-aspartate) O-methyltransferase [Gaiella sp.]
MNGAERARTRMVTRQLRRRGISDERVLAAMEHVPREAFVPEGLTAHAYDDAALPIGKGQTISQPYIVAAMCELLELGGTETVLDVGTGSGYAAAVLDELADAVVSVEVVPELAETARAALAATGHEGVEVRVADGRNGAPDRAPFEAIAVAAATDAIPTAFVEQLAPEGRLVVPVGGRRGQRLVRLSKNEDGLAETWSVACRFVPLVRG